MPFNHNSIIGYDDQFRRDIDLYSAHSITANGAGTAVTANPVGNLIDATPGTLWRRNGVAHAGLVQVEIVLTPKSTVAERQTAALLVVGNAYAVRQGTTERHPINIRCRVYNAAFGSLTYDGTIQPAVGFGFSSARLIQNYAFAIFGRGGDAQAYIDQADGGRYLLGGGVGCGLRLDFVMPTTPTGTFDLFCERLLYLRGLYCTVEPGISAAYRDPSQVARSYSGRPYATPKPVQSSLSMRLARVDQAMAYGGLNDVGNFQRSTVHAVNRIAGTTGTIAVVPDLQYSPVNGQTISTQPVPDTQVIVGQMDAPMNLEHLSAVSGAQVALYGSSLSVTSSL
jgi:hypothetical protein